MPKRKPTAWNLHVTKIKGLNPEKSFKEVLVLAAKTYKKSPVAKVVDAVMPSEHHKEKKHHSKKHHGKTHHKGGSDCMLPAADGSGSVTQADLVECGTAPSAAAPVLPAKGPAVPSAAPSNDQSGGKRKRKSRKAHKGRRGHKSRKAHKGRKSRKAHKGRKSRKSRKARKSRK